MHQVNRTLLQEAVFQLIQHHHDDEQMLQEVTQVKNQETVKSERCFDRYRDVLNSCLGHKKLNNDGSALMPEKIVSKLLLTQSSLQKQIFTEKQKEEVRTLICCLAAVLRDVTFQRPRILNLLCAERCLPILFLHHLHQDEVLPVQSYLTYKLKDGKFISAITDSMMAYLQSLAWDDSNKITNDILIFRDVFHQILMVCFCEQSNSTACIKLSKAIIEVFITKLLDVITKKDCSLRLPDLVSTCQFNVAQRFSSLAIQTVLGYSPVYKVADALKNKDWTFTQIQSPLLEWFKMLILPLDTTSVLDIIKQILEQQEVNWNLVLTFLSTVFVCLPDANPLLQDYIMEMLQSGLEDCNIENFVIGYLFARQGCREGSAVFMSYADWFQRTFGNSKSLANSRKTFTFFVKFLTDIVPYEEAQFLKVHILRPPYVPQKCGELLKDYLLLPKTRLADLKQPIDRIGVYDNSSSNQGLNLSNQIEEDICMAVASFESNRKIPSAVMEASIFKKPYFVGKFLPILLKPRLLPDVPDIRMDFIEALRKVDKIPTSMYTTYREKCKAETAMLIDGTFLEDEEDMYDMEPLEQLQCALDNLLKSVNSSKSQVSEHVAMIREKMECFKDGAGFVASEDFVIDIDSSLSDLPEQEIKVVDCILNFYCTARATMSSNNSTSFYWADCLMNLLTEKKWLHKALLSRYWTLITEQSSDLDDYHSSGLAVFLAHLAAKQEHFPSVRVICPRKSCNSYVGMVNILLWEHLLFYTKVDIQCSLRLTIEYFNSALMAFQSAQLERLKDQIFPLPLCKMFLFLCQRFLNESHLGYLISEEALQSLECHLNKLYSLKNSAKIQDIVNNQKISLREWLSYEMLISPERDILCFSLRQQYYRDTLYKTYLSEDEENLHDCTDVCSTLLQEIIHADLRCMISCAKVTCHKCHSNQTVRGYQQNRSSFISLLQGICCHLPGHTDTQSAPWLIQQLQNLLKTDQQTDFVSENSAFQVSQEQSRVQSFMRVAFSLSPFLFFCDNVFSLESSYTYSASIDTINKLLRSTCCDGIILSLEVAMYLLQGLSQIASYHVAVISVLERSPLLLMSSLVHYKSTARVLKSLTVKGGNSFIDDFKSALSFLYSSFSNDSFTYISNPWVTAGLILAMMNSEKCSSVTEQQFGAMFSQRFDLKNLEICCSVLLSKMAESEIHTMSKDFTLCKGHTLLKCMVRQNPSLFSSIQDSSHLQFIQTAIPEYLITLSAWIILKFMKDTPTSSDVLLDRVSLTLKQYSVLAPIIATSSGVKEDTSAIFSSQDLLELNSFIKSTLSSASRNELLQINQEILQACGISVTMEYTAAMKKFQTHRRE